MMKTYLKLVLLMINTGLFQVLKCLLMFDTFLKFN